MNEEAKAVVENPVEAKCACAECGEVISYPLGEAGRIIACPKCKVRTQLPAADSGPSEADDAEAVPAPRPKICPACGGFFDSTLKACPECATRHRHLLVWIWAAIAVALVAGTG